MALRLTLAVPVSRPRRRSLAFVLYGGEDDEQARNGILIALPTILFDLVLNTLTPIFQVRLRMDRVAAAEILSQALGRRC